MFNIEDFLMNLESGELRAAHKDDRGFWVVNTEVKQNILKVFKEGKLKVYDGLYEGFVDKDTLPTREFSLVNKVRMVPGGSSVRRGAYLATNTVIMPPSYINIGAHIDEGTMVDSHVLVGSCAQIGKRVHLSAGVQIGGVLEPIGMTPVIIEDDAFIGADAVIVEGIRVGKKAVIAPGVILSRALPVYDCVHGKVLEKGQAIPDFAVVISGSRPMKNNFGIAHGLHQYCPMIIKYRDEKSEASLVLEEALR